PDVGARGEVLYRVDNGLVAVLRGGLRQDASQTLLAEHFALFIAGFVNAVGPEEEPVPHFKVQVFAVGGQLERGQHAKGQVLRSDRLDVAAQPSQIGRGQAAVPEGQSAFAKIQFDKARAAEHAERKNPVQLVIHFAENVPEREALVHHAVEGG